MKIRYGFVSNSSSSSFIVAFPRIPSSIEDTKYILFGNAEENIIGLDYYDKKYTTSEIATTVFDEIQNQQPAKISVMIETIERGWVDDMPENPDRYTKKSAEDFSKKLHIYALQKTEKFIEYNQDKIIFIFHFSDNDGSYEGTLEHGDIFNRLNHIHINEH